MVDWKKEKPIMKREVPLVLGAIFISALADIMAVNFVWSKY